MTREKAMKMRAGDTDGGGFGAETRDGAPDPDTIARREEKVRAEFWDKFRRVAARIPFADDLVAAYYCAMDAQTPLRVRGMLLGALVYFIMPADAVPDLITGIGFTDDAAVLATVVSLLGQHIRPRHRVAAARALGKELPEEADGT